MLSTNTTPSAEGVSSHGIDKAYRTELPLCASRLLHGEDILTPVGTINCGIKINIA